MDEQQEEINNLKIKVEELEAIIAAMAEVSDLEPTSDIAIKINEVLSKFKLK